jgi:hypothetical protein
VAEADEVLVELELELELEMELMEIVDVVLALVLGLMLDEENDKLDVVGLEKGTVMAEVVEV